MKLVLSTHHYSKLLHLCTNLKSSKTIQTIHSCIITNGFPTNTTLNTRLIVLYTKNNDTKTARKMFDQMPEKRNIVTWTAMVSGYNRNGEYEEALRVFSGMHREGLRGNEFTYGSALSACTRLLSLEFGKQVHGLVEKGRFVENLFVQSALVDFHSKCGKMEDACCVFESMKTRDLVCWNAMIGGFAAQGRGDDAILTFLSMLREGMLPDSFSFGSLLRASAGRDGITKVDMIHGYIIQLGFGSHKFLSGCLVDAYVNCGSLASANRVYNHMQNKDVVSCTALITGYACEGKNCTEALRLFNEVQRKMAIDGMLLCSMLNICAKTASLSLGRQLHAHALKYQKQHDVAMGNAMIDMYSRSGAIEDARRFFDEMAEKNIISWSSLITGCGKHGYGHEAVALYEKMENEGFKANEVTFLSLLAACSHNGLITQGVECFSNMISKNNIVPTAKHYSSLVDILARAGRLEEAYNMVCQIPTGPDASILGAILGACSTHGNMSLGQIVARHLIELEPDNPTNYVVLSAMYAAAGLWNSARETRMLMEEKTNSKHPGYSLCE